MNTPLQVLRERVFNDSEIFVNRESICKWIDVFGIEMEREIIQNAHLAGQNAEYLNDEDEIQYYKNTFGKDSTESEKGEAL